MVTNDELIKIVLNALFKEYNIKHFSVNEILAKCSTTPPKHLIDNIIPTLIIVDAIRDDIGIPILINSAYRDPQYNFSIGGSKTSLHKEFNALDIRPSDSSYLGKIREWVLSNYEIPYKDNILLTSEITGLGLHYDTFVHIDTRGLLGRKAPARW